MEIAARRTHQNRYVPQRHRSLHFHRNHARRNALAYVMPTSPLSSRIVSPLHGRGRALFEYSSAREVFFLIGENDHVLWSDASDSPVRLPDSRARWEAIWERRERIVEIAHSHPIGPTAFSREDESTMQALVSALGRPLLFSVVSPEGMVRRLETDASTTTIVDEEPWWSALLRLASGMKGK